MNSEKIDEIMNKVIKVWIERFGITNIDPQKIEAVKGVLKESPHEDGLMRVQLIGGGATYLVPFEDIILNGLKGEDIEKYPIEKEEWWK
jgi:hypothetical protein